MNSALQLATSKMPDPTPRDWFRKAALSAPSPWWAECGPLALDDEGVVWVKGCVDEAATVDARRLGRVESDPEVPAGAEEDLDWLRREWRSATPRREVCHEWRRSYESASGA